MNVPNVVVSNELVSIVMEPFFNTTTIFKTKHRNQLQPEDDIRCTLRNTGP